VVGVSPNTAPPSMPTEIIIGRLGPFLPSILNYRRQGLLRAGHSNGTAPEPSAFSLSCLNRANSS
jgi:hypothetical protein